MARVAPEVCAAVGQISHFACHSGFRPGQITGCVGGGNSLGDTGQFKAAFERNLFGRGAGHALLSWLLSWYYLSSPDRREGRPGVSVQPMIPPYNRQMKLFNSSW